MKVTIKKGEYEVSVESEEYGVGSVDKLAEELMKRLIKAYEPQLTTHVNISI